jgi:hypothetical protein
MPEGTHSFPSWPGSIASLLSTEEQGRVELPKPVSRTCSFSRREDLPMSNRSVAGREGIEPP